MEKDQPVTTNQLGDGDVLRAILGELKELRRASSPDLHLVAGLSMVGPNKLGLDLSIVNRGEEIAEFTKLDFGPTTNVVRFRVDSIRATPLAEAKKAVFFGNSNPDHFFLTTWPIHAGTGLIVRVLSTTVPDGGRFEPPDEAAFEVEATVVARKFPVTIRRLRITKQQLNEVIAKSTAGEVAAVELED